MLHRLLPMFWLASLIACGAEPSFHQAAVPDAPPSAVASLTDTELVSRSVAVNNEARDIVTGALDDLGLEHLSSHTNFIMHQIRSDLQTYNNRMREAGFLVGRPFPPMLDWSRLSMGMPEDMANFAETLRDFRRKDWI